jgi:hypothetical protein
MTMTLSTLMSQDITGSGGIDAVANASAAKIDLECG